MTKRNSSIIVKSSKKTQLIDITTEVSDFVRSSGVISGMCFVYVPHTTAGVTINENADPDVRGDILKGLEAIVPKDLGYEHAEGNSPAHIKASLIGNSVQLLVEDGSLLLGTWQGVYFCEFDGPRTRKVDIKILEG
jgi:secondary thiamine-phosphate synthase enzyme